MFCGFFCCMMMRNCGGKRVLPLTGYVCHLTPNYLPCLTSPSNRKAKKPPGSFVVLECVFSEQQATGVIWKLREKVEEVGTKCNPNLDRKCHALPHSFIYCSRMRSLKGEVSKWYWRGYACKWMWSAVTVLQSAAKPPATPPPPAPSAGCVWVIMSCCQGPMA